MDLSIKRRFPTTGNGDPPPPKHPHRAPAPVDDPTDLPEDPAPEQPK